MRRLGKRMAWTWALGGALAASAFGQNVQDRRGMPAAPRAPANGAAAIAKAGQAVELDTILNKWAAQSAQTQTLDAKFQRTDQEPDFKRKTTYDGRAILQAPNLACLSLYELDQNQPTGKTFHEKIICDGQKVYRYVGSKKQLFIYALPVAERQRAIEEGPLRFLFNMRVEEVKQRFDMALLSENEKQYLIRFIPRIKEDREGFIKAGVWLNKQTLLPDRLVLVQPNGKDTETYEFAEIRRNAAINPVNFQFEPMPKWAKQEFDANGNLIQGNRPAAAPPPQVGNGRPARKRIFRD
jgi:TIGR03009 family protein